MRCPYCNGLNSDEASFCVRCGRDLSQPPAATPRPFAPAGPQNTVYPPTATTQHPGQAYPPPPARPAGNPPRPPQSRPTVYPSNPPAPPAQAKAGKTKTPTAAPRPTTQRPAKSAATSMVAPISDPVPPAPEPPVAFPPHKVAQLAILAQEGLEYQILKDDEGYGKKKIVRIQYRRCAPWQQVATLLKALAACQDTKYDTIIIQGVYNQERNVYEYTNGQLIFDRRVRLGSQLQERYQVETDNGYSAEAQRIVLAE